MLSKNYIGLEKVKTQIVIYLQSIKKWLYKLGYKNKDIYKDKFIDRYKWLDIIKDYKKFLNKMEELKCYIVECNKSSVIKPKIYPSNYIRSGNYL